MQTPTLTTPIENVISFDLIPDQPALLPTRQLAEIVNLETTDIIPIPEMPAAVAGVCSWQGDILWVVDLSYWIGSHSILTESNLASNCSLLKVKCQGGHLGLLVHQVGQLQSCDLQDIQPMKPGLPSAKSHQDTDLNPRMTSFSIRQECIKSLWNSPSGEVIPILDLDIIVQHLVQ